jgi:nicotinamidase-related amidase
LRIGSHSEATQRYRMSAANDAPVIDKPAPGGVGLLLLDVINTLDFEGAEALAPSALDASETIARLRDQADKLSVPVIYVNDNYGHWGSDKEKLVDMCAAASPSASRLIAKLRPRPHHYFVIKPQFSGFYATNLPVLLPKLGVNRLLLTGFAGDICVLFTAADAHMRDYDLWVPGDAVASEDDERNAWALDIMRKSMDADITPAGRQDLADWVRGGKG